MEQTSSHINVEMLKKKITFSVNIVTGTSVESLRKQCENAVEFFGKKAVKT